MSFLSSGGAKEFSPRRKPWGKYQPSSSPGGAKGHANNMDCSYAPSGLDHASSPTHGLRRGLEYFAPPGLIFEAESAER